MNILEVNHISKSFSGKKILDNISFSISEGEIVGFVGPNGAGKTTTIRLITNLIHSDKGNVSICGCDLIKEREKALSNAAAIIENPSLYTFLSGFDNIDFIRKINNISKEKVNKIIEFIGLSDRINDKVKKYSLGMKQRLALGICLLTEPKLLILDEPTNGLDPSGTLELRKILVSLTKENKTSILISSHILSEIEKICDKIIFIKDGKIISIKDNK
jgi:ABC-2 type transport system ATP-binding protein